MPPDFLSAKSRAPGSDRVLIKVLTVFEIAGENEMLIIPYPHHMKAFFSKLCTMLMVLFFRKMSRITSFHSPRGPWPAPP